MARGRRKGRPTPVKVRPGRRSGPLKDLDLSQALAKLAMADREKRAAATRDLARVDPRSDEAIDILARLIKSRAWPKPRGLERVSATHLLATFKTEADFQGTINDVSAALALMDVVHDVPSRRDYAVAMVKAAPRKYRKKLARLEAREKARRAREAEERVRGWLEAARQEQAAAAVATEQETLRRWATLPATSPRTTGELRLVLQERRSAAERHRQEAEERQAAERQAAEERRLDQERQVAEERRLDQERQEAEELRAARERREAAERRRLEWAARERRARSFGSRLRNVVVTVLVVAVLCMVAGLGIAGYSQLQDLGLVDRIPW